LEHFRQRDDLLKSHCAEIGRDPDEIIRSPGSYRCDVGLHLSQIDEADELLTKDPLALLIAMVLDQQIGQTRYEIRR
jgi:hypothetical protein